MSRPEFTIEAPAVSSDVLKTSRSLQPASRLLLENRILPVTSDNPGYLGFLRDAHIAVGKHLDRAVDMVVGRKLGVGRWHPNGFATFEVAVIEGLGLMRLHFWPRRLRRALDRQPRIHKHCFNLYSRILAGEYRESQYETKELAHGADGDVDEHDAGHLLREYLVEPMESDGIDRLVEGGRWLNVRSTLTGLRFAAGSWHEVEVGKYHATPIPPKAFCATLAVLSVPVPGARDALVGSAGFRAPGKVRPTVTENEIRTICSQFVESAGRQDSVPI